MGGTVAVTIRRENGELLKMARRTGSYSWMFTSKKFNNGQVDEAIDDYYKNFAEMKEDYESGEPHKFEMTSEYGWCNETMPVGYGLVFIDVMKKEIHSMQNYDNPGVTSLHYFSNVYLNDEETDDALESLLVNNQLNLYIQERDGSKRELGSVHDVFGKDINSKKMQEFIESSYQDKGVFFDLVGKMGAYDVKGITKGLKGYNIVRHAETPEGLIEFAKTLQSNGIVFNEEEKKGWTETLEELIEQYELEDDVENYEEKLEEAKEVFRNNLRNIFSKEMQNKLKL